MVTNQSRSKRKPSGARYKQQKVRRQHEMGRQPVLTKIDVQKQKTVRTLGGNAKHKLLSAREITLADSSNKTIKAIIATVLENPANRHFIRRNILTKGTIVETDKGKAKITSRPGQAGSLHGVLVQ